MYWGFAGGAAEGENTAFIYLQSGGLDQGVSQVLGATLEANIKYVLSVWVGNPLYNYDEDTAPSRLELLADGVLLASVDGASPGSGLGEYYSLTYTSDLNDAQLGEELEIRLIAESAGFPGYGIDFDDVILTATAVLSAVDDDGDGYTVDVDCNDDDADVNPGVAEFCDGIDNNCDEFIDEGFDADADGTADCFDQCPDDANKTDDPGACGCGNPETGNTDGDEEADCVDSDDDNDGQLDADEIECYSDPLDATSLSADNDSDNTPDCVDDDDDNDGIIDDDDTCPLEDATGQDANEDGCIDTIKESQAGIVDDLLDLPPTGNKKTDKRIDKAEEHLLKSLADKLWDTDSTLTKKGKKVFDEEKKAVKELKKIHDPAILDIIKSIVGISNSLAQTAIDGAIAAGGSQKEIDKALKEMDKALKELDHTKKDGDPDPKYDKAIDHYKKAWEHAQKVMK